MSIREEKLYDTFMEIFNVVSDSLRLSLEVHNNVEKDFLKYLLFDAKLYNETAEIFDTISELLTMYMLFQQYANLDEILNTIEDLLREQYVYNYPPKAPKFPKETTGKHKETETDEF